MKNNNYVKVYFSTGIAPGVYQQHEVKKLKREKTVTKIIDMNSKKVLYSK